MLCCVLNVFDVPYRRSNSQAAGGGNSASGAASSGSSKVKRTARISTGGYRPGSSGRMVMGSRSVVPATYVPEELVTQAQVVLQGKSRHLIIRELQRTVRYEQFLYNFFYSHML